MLIQTSLEDDQVQRRLQSDKWAFMRGSISWAIIRLPNKEVKSSYPKLIYRPRKATKVYNGPNMKRGDTEETFMEAIGKLNSTQREAVDAIEGPVMVIVFWYIYGWCFFKVN